MTTPKEQALINNLVVEVNGLRQGLMLTEKTVEQLQGIQKNQSDTIEALKLSRSMWRKQAGVATFALCAMVIVALTFWMLNMQAHKKLDAMLKLPCPQAAEVQGERYEAAPDMIVAPRNTEILEL